MGLTIHYQINVPNKWSIATVREKLEALRQASMDLPVVGVSELQEVKGSECELGENQGEPFRWAKIQSGRRVESPWEHGYYFQQPHHAIMFAVDLAPGSEPMNIGIRAELEQMAFCVINLLRKVVYMEQWI